jgi:hypothetical protein
MDSIVAGFAKFIRERFLGHIPSTITGWLVPALVEVAVYWDSTAGVAVIPEAYRPVIHVLALLVFAVGNSYKGAAKPPDSFLPPTPKGFGSLGFLIATAAVALLFLAVPVLARAEDPKFGGCVGKAQTTCFGPAVSVTMIAIDAKTADVQFRLDPNLGYAMTVWTDKWYKTSLGFYAGLNSTGTGKRLVPSAVVSVAEYVRVGVERQLGGADARTFFLFALGADFGVSGK